MFGAARPSWCQQTSCPSFGCSCLFRRLKRLSQTSRFSTWRQAQRAPPARMAGEPPLTADEWIEIHKLSPGLADGAACRAPFDRGGDWSDRIGPQLAPAAGPAAGKGRHRREKQARRHRASPKTSGLPATSFECDRRACDGRAGGTSGGDGRMGGTSAGDWSTERRKFVFGGTKTAKAADDAEVQASQAAVQTAVEIP